MVRRSGSVRTLLAALALVQMSAPFLAAMADALYAQDSEWVGVHIEEHRGPHDHWFHRDDCAFCQFLAQHAVVARGPMAAETTLAATSHVISTPLHPRAIAGPFLPDSRAPPAA